jgi:hypothetical protein
MDTPNAPVVTIVSAITAAVTSTLGLLAFLGVAHELVGALQIAAGGWIVVGAMLIHQRTTPTDQVALTKDEAEQLDRGAISIGLIEIAALVIIICGLVWLFSR